MNLHSVMYFITVLTAVLLGFCFMKSISLSTSVSQNGNVTISTTPTDWQTSCNGRKPAEVNVDWDTLSLDGDISIPENGSRFWIGYYRRYQYFSLKGCSSAGSGGTHIGNVDNPLGHCFFLCKYLNFIGLAGEVCHCLTDEAFNSLPINNAPCSYEICGGGLVCGRNSTMWVYGVAKKNFSSTFVAPNDVKKKCLSLTKTGSATWSTVECSQINRVLCMKKDGTFDRNESAVVRAVTWDAALKICHDKFENLANISLENYRSVILSQHIPDFQTGWTSFVRDMVVSTKDFNGNVTDLTDCAVFYKSEGKIKLDYDDCSNVLPAICLDELPITSTLTSTTTFTTTMATTRTSLAPTTTGTSNHPSMASSTMVVNTSDIQLKTTTSHTVATGTSPIEKSATRSIETRTTTNSVTQTTSTYSTTEYITTSVAISPSTSTLTTTARFTTPMTTTRRTAAPMTRGSNTSTTNISSQQPNTSTTIIFNTSTTQPTTSTKLKSAKDSTTTVTSVTSSTRPVTTNASITQGDTYSSSTTVFPMAGRIGLGILAILVVAGVVFLIKKVTHKEKRLPSIQTTDDSSDHKTVLSKGIPMLDVKEKEVSNSVGDNEKKMKGTSNDCFNDGDRASDPNYECIQDDSNNTHSKDRVGNSTEQNDNAYSTNSQYATVVKVGKSSPEITETTPESDTNTYDTTYVQQEKSRDTGDDYQHIYDHTNSKNPE